MNGGGADELVSVIISAFNSESYLEEALSSVFEQNWETLEVIVADDGSTDGTVEIARRFGSRVRIVEGSDQGLAATRNRGMTAANGAFFLHLDADDLLLPNAIRTLMGIFERERCDIVAGRLSCFVSPELSSDVASRFKAPTEPQRGHLCGVAIVRASVPQRLGGLDDSYQPASDMEWWLRAREQGIGIHLIDDVVLHRRIHGNNSSLRHSRLHKEVSLKIAREALKRRRTGNT